jgi:ferredoxin-nitrite reductase
VDLPLEVRSTAVNARLSFKSRTISRRKEKPVRMVNRIEIWKSEKHGFDVWPDIERHANSGTPMSEIEVADLERMKWHGFFYRKRDNPGRYMNRVRITAGELSATQAAEIASISTEMGHGIIDVTTRANLQVQGLEISHLPTVVSRLERVGLSSRQTGHDNVRNVFAHPYSGLMPDELIDTRALCHAITDLFLGNRLYADLPRKLNISLNGTIHHPIHFWTQDISFLARRTSDGEVLFGLLIAGTQGLKPHLAWPLPVLVAADQVVEVTRALLDLFRSRGSREQRNMCRMRHLVEDIGVDGVMEWLGQALPFELKRSVEAPWPAAVRDDLVGWFVQKDPDLWTMGLCVPLGRLTWQQLDGLARISQACGDGSLRTTHEQGIAVVNIPSSSRDAAQTAAAALGLAVDADALDIGTMACTGSQFCNIAVTETKGHMFRLIGDLRSRALKLHGVRIHMSGCPSSCALHLTADIGLKGVRVRRFAGTREGFDVFLGGGLATSDAAEIEMAQLYRLGVDIDQLPTLIENVVQDYYQFHEPGETFSVYWRTRLKSEQAEKVDEGDYCPPTWLCESCDRLHLGTDPPVSCPGCAGLRRDFVRLEPHQVTQVTESVERVPTSAQRLDVAVTGE